MITVRPFLYNVLRLKPIYLLLNLPGIIYTKTTKCTFIFQHAISQKYNIKQIICYKISGQLPLTHKQHKLINNHNFIRIELFRLSKF